MNFPRRTLLLTLLAGAATLSQAQSSPPIKLITPTPVGVGTDAFARLYADHLSRLMGTGAVVENKPGAAGTLGADAVAKSAPNGLTLLIGTSGPLTTAPSLLAKVPYKAQVDLVPVAQLFRGGSFLIASNSFPGKSLKEMVDTAKREPGKYNYSSYGSGSTSHLGMEMLQDAAGIELVHIPYRGSSMVDITSGTIAIGWEPPVSALPNIQGGRVKALAYTGDKRSTTLPDVPTLSELFPGLTVFTWVGVWAPAGTPEPVLARLAEAFNTINGHPEVLKALANAGVDPIKSTRAQMAAETQREAVAMERLIKAKGITVN